MLKTNSFARVFASTMLMTVIIPTYNQVGFADELTNKRAMTIDDDLKVVKVGDVLMSPDGEKVFYSLETLNWVENKFEKTFYIVASTGGPSQPYIGKDGGRYFRFSPNGSYFSFLRETEDEIDQIFVMRTSGGEAMQLSYHRGGVSDYRWTGDETSIIFVADEQGTEEEEKEYDLGADAIFINEDANGRNYERFSNLWSMDLHSRIEKRLTNERFMIQSFDTSPDGMRIVLAASPNGRSNEFGEIELFLVDLNQATVKRMTHNHAPESGPIWAPDGIRFAYGSPSDQGFDLQSGYIWIMNAETGVATRLDSQNPWEYTGDTTVWSADGRSIYYSEVRGLNTNLYQIDATTGQSTEITHVLGTLSPQAFSTSRNKLAYIFEDFDSPGDVFVSDIDGRNSVQLSFANRELEQRVRLVNAQAIQWHSQDGLIIEGVFYKPSRTDEKNASALIMDIHGGPSGVAKNAFRADFQVLAANGYAVLAPNYRGSSGYGNDFLNALKGEVGAAEYFDLMTGIDYTIENLNVDPDRLGLRGWSWGGINGSYTITQTQRFKAASLGAMVGNWQSETGPGLSFDLALWYIGGKPWDDPEEWLRRSSISFVKNVTTPTILLHGEFDQISTPSQSMMFLTALREIGKAPVRYIKFPRQGHGIDEPRLQRIAKSEELRWFKKYIDGIEIEIEPFLKE